MAYMGINLLLNSINRGLSISHYRKQGRFYRVNSHTVITSSRLQMLLHKKTTSQNLQRLEKPIQLIFCHVTTNLLIVCFNQFIFQFWIVCTPSGPNMKYSLFSQIECLDLLGLNLDWIWICPEYGLSDLLKFNSDWIWMCPKYGLSVQFMIYQSKWLIQWERSKKIFGLISRNLDW